MGVRVVQIEPLSIENRILKLDSGSEPLSIPDQAFTLDRESDSETRDPNPRNRLNNIVH